jgi:hypothetical protein
VDPIHTGVVAYQLATGWPVIRLEGACEGGLEVVESEFTYPDIASYLLGIMVFF